MIGLLERYILSRYQWHANTEPPDGYTGGGKVEALFGAGIWQQIAGRTVIDFGCGCGNEALEMARRGAAWVIGVDTWEPSLARAWRTAAADPGARNYEFLAAADGRRAEVIFSIDSFEHFPHPAAVLQSMADLLLPGGKVFISFGPPWYHPKGLHMPLFPWAHVVLSEGAIMRWRAQYKNDGATRYEEVAGGLNQMTVARFERLVKASPLKFESMKAVPIRAFRRLHCRMTREFFTSVVQAVLVHKTAKPA